MSSKLIVVDDDEAEALPQDNNVNWAFGDNNNNNISDNNTNNANVNDDALSFIVLPPSDNNSTNQVQSRQRVPLISDDLRQGSGAFDDLDALFGDVPKRATPTKSSSTRSTASTAAAAVIDLTSVQVLSDELRRTAQLRALVLRALGELESIAQLLVDSAWSFPTETRQYSAPCGDRERTLYVASFTAAARDRARLDALRRQLRAICFAHERTHFLALCEVSHSELRLAHAVDSLDAAVLSGDARRRLLDCLFQTLSEDEGVGSAASVRTASVVHELIAAVAAASARGVEPIPPVYALDRLGECGGGAWGARWLFRSTAADVIAGGLIERIFAGMQRSPPRVWQPVHYLSLLNRIDWRAVCLAIPQQSLHLVIEPLVGGLLSTAGRSGFANVDHAAVPGARHVHRAPPVLLARVFDALSLAPWPARGIAVPFLALMPWERADASLLRVAFARLYELPQGVNARQWSASRSVGGRTAHLAPQRPGAPPRAPSGNCRRLCTSACRASRARSALADATSRRGRGVGCWQAQASGAAKHSAAAATTSSAVEGDTPDAQDGDTLDETPDARAATAAAAAAAAAAAQQRAAAGSSAAAPAATDAAKQNQNLGMIALFRVLGVLAEADVRLFDGQDKPPTLAVRVIDELCYFAFVHTQAGASLWILRNESFLELARLVRATPSLMSFVFAALTRDLPSCRGGGRGGVSRLRAADADARVEADIRDDRLSRLAAGAPTDADGAQLDRPDAESVCARRRARVLHAGPGAAWLCDRAARGRGDCVARRAAAHAV
jgi:hypothetical protein